MKEFQGLHWIKTHSLWFWFFWLWASLHKVRLMENTGRQLNNWVTLFIMKKINLLWNKWNLDSISGIALKNVWLWENAIDVLSLSFFSYETGIVVYVTINIKCDTLNYDCMIGIYCNTFEQQSDIIRIRLKRTIWTASGEPIFGGQNKHGETW